MHGDLRPFTMGTLAAKLEAYAAQPFPATSDDGILTTPGLTGQKMAALLRTEYPPIPLSDMEDVRAIMPELIDVGEQFVTAEDPMTVVHGYSMLLMSLGLGLGLRRVPYSVVNTLAAYAEPGDGLNEIRAHGISIAELVRKVYPPISDEEFSRVEAWLPGLIDHSEKMSQHPAAEINTLGNAFLGVALGIGIGLRKVPISVLQEFVPSS